MKKNFIQFFTLSMMMSSAFADAGLFFQVKSNGPNILLNTVVPGHIYKQAGIKIITSGYSINNAGIDCTMADNGYCLFEASDAATKIFTIAGQPGGYEINLCLDGENEITCQKYGVSGTTAQKLAYIGNYNTGDTSRCQIDGEDFTLNNCMTAATLGLNVTSTFINAFTNRIYFASANGFVTRCMLSNATGAVTNCVNQNIGSGTLLESIKINAASTKAYLGGDTGNLTVCNLNQNNGSLESCATSATSTSPVTGMALTTKRLYAASGTNVLKCSINSNGSLSGCAPTATGFSFATAISLNVAATRAYVADCTANKVSFCKVNTTTGALSNCQVMDPDFICPFKIMLNNSNTAAYVTNYTSSTVSICTIDEDGLFNGCTDTGSGFNGPSNGDLL